MLLDYSYQWRIATPSAANAFAFTLMTFLSNSYHVIARGFRKRYRHDHACGSVEVNGQRCSKAAAAGRYPDSLCREWAEIHADSIRRHFWRGVTPWSRHSLGRGGSERGDTGEGERLSRLPTSIA